MCARMGVGSTRTTANLPRLRLVAVFKFKTTTLSSVKGGNVTRIYAHVQTGGMHNKICTADADLETCNTKLALFKLFVKRLSSVTPA